MIYVEQLMTLDGIMKESDEDVEKPNFGEERVPA
jgi:hypothetical protein